MIRMYLSQLKEYTGTDIDLGISLYRYGMAWKYIKKDHAYKFYFKADHGKEPNDYRFDCITLDANIDVWKEYNWITEEDKISLFETMDYTEKEFNKLPFPEKINDLFGYYGADDIFGGSNNPFPITTNQY